MTELFGSGERRKLFTNLLGKIESGSQKVDGLGISGALPK